MKILEKSEAQPTGKILNKSRLFRSIATSHTTSEPLFIRVITVSGNNFYDIKAKDSFFTPGDGWTMITEDDLFKMLSTNSNLEETRPEWDDLVKYYMEKQIQEIGGEPEPQGSLAKKILRFLEDSTDATFLSREFYQFGSIRSVNRAVNELIETNRLAKVGSGIYTKVRRIKGTDSVTPTRDLMDVGIEAYRKLGIPAEPGTPYQDLSSGKSTQVPMIPIVNVGKSRTKRKISMGPWEVHLERDF